MDVFDPGVPLPFSRETPGMLASIICVMEMTGRSFCFSVDMIEAAPVYDDFFTLPYPVTTTSSMTWASSFMTILSGAKPLIF